AARRWLAQARSDRDHRAACANDRPSLKLRAHVSLVLGAVRSACIAEPTRDVTSMAMPEFPEVETVVRLIRPRLAGRRIEACEVRWERTLGGLSKCSFADAVVGSRVTRVWRRAKFIVADLERD